MTYPSDIIIYMTGSVTSKKLAYQKDYGTRGEIDTYHIKRYIQDVHLNETLRHV